MSNFDTKVLERKWGSVVKVVESVKKEKLSPEKKNVLLHALENTNRRVKYTEATNPGNIGQYKKYALDLVTAVVPNLIAFDLVGVQPMDNRSGMINYFNFNYSNSKGNTKAGDTFNSSLNMGPSDKNYASDLVKDEKVFTGAVTTSTSIILNWVPVKVDTFKIVVKAADGTVRDTAITTPGSYGAFEGATMRGEVTPAGTIEFTTAPTGAAATDEVFVTYRYDNTSIREDGFEAAGFTNIPAAELEIKSVPVNAETRSMRAYWAFDAEYELAKEYGQDLESLLATQITGELAHEIDAELTKGIYDFANAAPIGTWSRTPDIGVSRWEHYNGFGITLQENAAAVFQATQKYGANFAVCGTQAAVIFKSLNGFEPANTGSVAGPHYIGSVDGIKVYVDPAYAPMSYVVGFKGSNALEAGVFYCPYMPVSSTDLIMDANFRGQRGWATSYGKAFINDKLYAKGAIVD